MDDPTTTKVQTKVSPGRASRRVLWIFAPHIHLLLAVFIANGIYAACMTSRVVMLLPAARIFHDKEVKRDADGNAEVDEEGNVEVVSVPKFFAKDSSFSPILTRLNELQGSFETTVLGYLEYVPGLDLDSKSQLERSQIGTVATLIIYFFIIALASAAANLAKQYFSALLVSRSVILVRVKLLRNLMQQELAFYNREKRGEMVTRLGTDVEQTTQCLRLLTKDLIEAPLNVLVPILVMFIAKWWMGVLGLVYIGIITLSLRKQTRKVHKRARKRQKTISRVQESMLQMFSGIRVVKAFGLEKQKVQEYEQRNEDWLRQTMATEITKAFTRVRMEFFVNGAILVVLLVGFFMIGRPTAMDLAAVGLLLAMLIQIYKPMKTTTRSITELLDKLAGAVRVFEYMDIKPELTEKPDAIEAKDVVGTVRFEDVSFSYDNNGKVLEHINLEVPAGEVVALVGPSGAGKSTLVNMVPRFHDPVEGGVTVDSTDIRDFTRDSLLSNIAIVTQEPFLFHASIRENIAYGRPGATTEEICAAAEAANADEFIANLENGYDTVVGEGGGKLSGGQRQRITIARALIRDARILVLDEATSNLDTESERLVQAALERLMEGRTTLVIAHRLSTIQHADKICVMQDGRICEVGSHDQLMASETLYRRLYQMQFAPKGD
ncbi:MAG: ABC transporter ATP-binding protein [Planctomycetota bacterium]